MEPGCQHRVVPDNWWLTQREILTTSTSNDTEAGTLMMSIYGYGWDRGLKQ